MPLPKPYVAGAYREPRMTALEQLLDRLWLQATDDLSSESLAAIVDIEKALEVGYKLGAMNALQVIGGGERSRRPLVRDAILEAVALYENDE